MELAEFLRPEGVIARLRSTSKKQALQDLSRRASQIIGHSEREIFDVLMMRERLGTTGVGNGIAIPHGKLSSLERLYALFARLDHPIDFDSIDERPVDLICVVLAPEREGTDHLNSLSRLSRMLRDKAACEKFRGTDDAEELYALLIDTMATWVSPNRPDNPAA